MKEFSFTITDPLGIHARPAGIIVKKAAEYESIVEIIKGEKTADAKRIFSLMGLSAKGGDNITIRCSGSDENIASDELKKLFEENL